MLVRVWMTLGHSDDRAPVTDSPRQGRLKTLALGLLVATSVSSCHELRARHEAREGNRLYRGGEYRAALEHYRKAERLAPDLAVAVLNKGLACQQLILAGDASKESQEAVECALAAYTRLQQLLPEDMRGRELYIQTLFDAERFGTLEVLYQAELLRRPNDSLAINGLIQVYSRWGKPADALTYTLKRAELHARDPEAQYAVGVLVFNRLHERGGGSDKASFNPLSADAETAPPVFGPDDIVGEQRLELAELGIEHLKKALALRPDYAAALSYLNLLYRQKAYALFDRPEQWRAALDSALAWQQQALSTKMADSAAGTPTDERP